MDWIKLLRGISRHLISPDTSSRKPEICTWFETGSHCNSPACVQSMTHLRTIYQLHRIRMYPVTVWAPSVSLVCVELLSVCDVCVLYFATLGEKTYILDALKWFQDVSRVFFDIPAGCGDRAWISYSSTDALAGAILGSSLPHRAFFTSRYMRPQK